jgi:hypothetical protein
MPRKNKRAAVDRSAKTRNSRTPDRPEPAPINKSNRSSSSGVSPVKTARKTSPSYSPYSR